MIKNYKNAGVDIEAGDDTVNRIKPLVRSTFNERVLTDIGLFGGFFDAKFEDYEHPILVASTDGVGTKLKIAFLTNIHNTVGQCLVNHCVNDILCCGAKPLFFLDYFATGKLNPSTAEQIVSGFVTACKENSCALIGGETAEMPSLYQEGEYDISGTIVGIVEKNKIINGSNIKKGDLLIGLPSSGLHTNGYSLARVVLLSKYDINHYFEEIGKTLAEELLTIHKSYFHNVYPLLDENLIKGISHITGGGIIGNTKRILPKDLTLFINWEAWEKPFIFDLIQKEGNISDNEMRNVFNLGIGMILIIEAQDLEKTLKLLENVNPIIIGEII